MHLRFRFRKTVDLNDSLNMEITFFVVEDQPIEARTITKVIQDMLPHAEICTFHDGNSFLDFLWSNRGDVSGRTSIILLDLYMPKVNGLQVLERLNDDEDFNQIPTYILTDTSSDNDIFQIYAVGAASYVSKPLDKIRLESILMDSKVQVKL